MTGGGSTTASRLPGLAGTALAAADTGSAGTRVMAVVSLPTWVRSLFDSGSMDRLAGPNLWIVASSDKTDPESLRLLESFPARSVTAVTDPRPEVARSTKTRRNSRRALTFDYQFLQYLLMYRVGRHSPTIRQRALAGWVRRKARFMPLLAAPGVRHLLQAWVMWRSGLHPELSRMMREVRPDVVLTISGGYDSLSRDAIRCARAEGIPTLGVVPNWDALADKAGFIVKPDRLAVWGEQSRDWALRIHGFRPEQVHVLGPPVFEKYFHYERGSRPSPFPFPYVLFAGATRPFDERAPVQRMNRVLEKLGSDVKVVYRPHPDRRRRKPPDQIDEASLEHVVIDPQVRDLYLRHFESYAEGASRFKELYPSLDYYPPLLEHAEFVICPLSTMTIEAALFERRVLVPAYHDGLHKQSPAMVRTLPHFEGVDRIDGIDFCDSEDELMERFAALLVRNDPPASSMREALRSYLHQDPRPLPERLAELVQSTAGRDPKAA